VSKQYLMLKCFTMLAQEQPACCLPVAQLQERLNQQKCLGIVTAQHLIELGLEQAATRHLFHLVQDTEGELNMQLRLPLEDEALQQLISLGANVTAIPAVVSQKAIKKAGVSWRPTARVAASTVVLDGLQGHCFHHPDGGDNMAMIVLEFATCLLSWIFLASRAIVQRTTEEGQPVRVCLRIFPVGRPDVQVDLLSLTFIGDDQGGCQQSKLLLPGGKGFNFQKGQAIPMAYEATTPPLPQAIMDKSVRSEPLGGGKPSQTVTISSTPDNIG
jgi:hypothetical protein